MELPDLSAPLLMQTFIIELKGLLLSCRTKDTTKS